MHLSYWELDTYFRNIDFVVVGSGIVGLNTAYHLRQRHPKAKIVVLEKGALPEGASTKNAGFACFGTLSEILSYLDQHPPEEIYQLIERRVRGLQKLRKLLGDESITYQQHGGYELFREEDLALEERARSEIERINRWLYPLFGDKVFHFQKDTLGFGQLRSMIYTPFEGHIHTGNMMQALLQKVRAQNILVLQNIQVSGLMEQSHEVRLELNQSLEISCKKVFLCTNAFTRQLYALDVVPARAQVLITQPLAHLPFKGCFHLEEGFYYFRNTGNRILLGGGRNLDIAGETTTSFGLTNPIQEKLEQVLREIILPGIPYTIDHRWSGIMGMGPERTPIVKRLSQHVFCGVRLSGTGIAIGSIVGEELAGLLEEGNEMKP